MADDDESDWSEWAPEIIDTIIAGGLDQELVGISSAIGERSIEVHGDSRALVDMVTTAVRTGAFDAELKAIARAVFARRGVLEGKGADAYVKPDRPSKRPAKKAAAEPNTARPSTKVKPVPSIPRPDDSDHFEHGGKWYPKAPLRGLYIQAPKELVLYAGSTWRIEGVGPSKVKLVLIKAGSQMTSGNWDAYKNGEYWYVSHDWIEHLLG